MKKKESGSKKLKWILIVVGILILAAAAVFGIIFLGQQSKDEGGVQDPVLYWNVEGADYRSGQMTRMAGEDGTVHMIFAKDGEQFRLPVKDITLANKIDMMNCAGLVLDANGLVVDAVHVEDFTGGFAANEYVVTAVEGNKITCNSSGLLDGHEVTIEITDDTPIWNIGGSGITVGIPWTVAVDDVITAIKNEDGSIMCIYTEPYEPPQDIYWNVQRLYDSKTKLSTREMDVTGKYRITLACNGEQKEFVVSDHEIVNDIDQMAAKCFGLEFDEEGNITRVIHAGTATGGGSCASWFHCISLDGQNAEFKRIASGSNMGSTYSGVLAKDCKIYDVSGMGSYVGEPTELRVGDQVHCLRDSRSRICVVYVVNRQADSEIYWNVERKYDSTAKTTTRTPAADGWYYITVAVRGEQITVKTKDWDIVNSIDGRAAKCFGLKLDEDNVIEKFYTPDAVTGGGTFASWYDVTELDGNKITVQKAGTDDIRSGVLAEDCEIYDVSSTATVVGQVTELKVGDRVHTLKNMDGEICVCYVVTRYVDWPVYYNLDRKYDSTTKSTTRTPDADGYYVFRMAYDGEEVTYKTKSLTVANAIDKEVAKCLTMSVDSNGIVYKAMHASNATIAKGGATSSWTTVTELSKNGFTTYKSENDKYTEETYAWNCKVYNVSTNFIDHQGEETELQVGDFVHCLKNRRGEVTFVYIMTRYMDADVYYNLDRMWDDATGTSTRTPDADGVYSIQMAFGGEEVTVKTTDPEVVNNIDKEVAMCVGLLFDENGYCTYATHAKNTDYCRGGIGMSYATVTAVEGDQVTVRKSGTLTTFTISEDCEMFVTANIEDLTRGQYTTVRVGDFIHCLKDSDGKTNYMAIMSRVKQLPVEQHSCQHVTEDVTWYAWDGEAFPQEGFYVLTEDLEMDSRVNIDAGTEITLCLNGHTVTNTDRFFSVYGTLNICDHKNAAGTYDGKLSSSFTGSGYGGIAYIYNSSDDGTVNVYGGTIEHTGELTSGGVFYVGNTTTSGYTATLNIYDGTLTGGNTTGVGAGIEISNKGVVNMYGGTLTGCTSDGNGGGMRIDSGTFNMTGGVIEGNKAGEGGNLSIGSSGTVNISGDAVIRNGIATNGANVQVIGKFNLTDGAKLTGGTVSSQGTAISAYANAASAHAIITVNNATVEGTVRLDTGKGPVEMIVIDSAVTGQIKVGTNNCTLTVGGKVELAEVRLLDGKVITIHEDGLDDASTIAVTVDNTEKAFTTITDPNDEKCFAPVDSAIYKIVNNNNDLYLESTVKPHIHCACNGEAVGKPNHTCADTEYMPWPETNSLPTSGKYYLTGDVTVSSTYEIRGELSLCLNGYTITGSTRIYKIYSTFNLSDCAAKNTDGTYKGMLLGTQTKTTLGPVFYMYKGGTFNLFGGELTVSETSKTAQVGIGGVQVGTMNMYGGNISGGNVTGKGGCISIFDEGTLRLYGGTISGGKAAGGGGNIYVAKGTLEIHDGATVSGGYTEGTGGNIWMDTSSLNHFLMDGGLVTGGKTVATSDKSGGNMDIRCADAKITGGTVSNGYAYEGGNIRVGNNGNLTIGGDAVIKEGKATNGGNIAVFSTLTVEGNAQIKDGEATSMGGNLSSYANAATATANITIKGGTFSGGTAKGSAGGGSIRLDSNNGTVNMTIIGGTIENGTASVYPGVKVGPSQNIHVTVGGNAKIESLGIAAGQTVAISTETPLATGASIGIYMETVGTFAENVTTDVSGFFKSLNTGASVAYDTTGKSLKLA